MKDTKRKIFEFDRFYNTTFKEYNEESMMEQPKRYIMFKLYKEKKYLKTLTTYKCPFCGFRKHNDHQCEKKETKNEITFKKKCDECKKIIVFQTFKKEEL